MTAYLLSARVALGVILGEQSPDTKVKTWLDGINSADTFFVSEIAIGQLLSSAHRKADPDERERWIHALTEEVPNLFGSRRLPITREVVEDWAKFRLTQIDGFDALAGDNGLDLAVARTQGLTYACRVTPLIQSIYPKVVDPWAS